MFFVISTSTRKFGMVKGGGFDGIMEASHRHKEQVGVSDGGIVRNQCSELGESQLTNVLR